MELAPEEEVIAVGSCRILPGSRRVFAGGRPVRIGGRAFDLLMALVERNHRVVTREELHDLVWPGVAVEPNNLHVQVWMLRRIIGPSALKTIPRRGYRLVARVERSGSASPRTTIAPDRDRPAPLDESTERVMLAMDRSRWVTVTGGERADRGRAVHGAIAAWRRRSGGVVWHVTATADRVSAQLARLAGETQLAILVVVEEVDHDALLATGHSVERLGRGRDVRMLATTAVASASSGQMLVPVSPATRKNARESRPAAREVTAQPLRWRSRVPVDTQAK